MRTRDKLALLVALAAAAAASLAAAESESEGEADGDGRNLHELPTLHNPYRSRGASLVYKTFHHRDRIQWGIGRMKNDKLFQII